MNNNISVSFGKPITAPYLIPVLYNGSPMCINNPLLIDGEILKVTVISLGRPHGVLFVDDLKSVDVKKIGALLGTNAIFPKGASIIFAKKQDEESLETRLWQHGEGETAYTNEAAAVAGTVAIMLNKTCITKVKVTMGGNSFLTEWGRGENDEVILTGKKELMD
ncbi:MAG: hypothetical protein FWG91_02230 [Lachnospiraceae bacterium]|nr:hypothetical protein [Lachnospiraceae bacterium]